MMKFSIRNGCPACGHAAFTTIWSGRFSDSEVTRMLDRFFYNVDLQGALGDQPFSLVQCIGCGFRFHSHVLADEWIPVVYGEWINRDQIEKFEAAHVSRPPDKLSEKLQGVRFLMRLQSLATSSGFHPDELALLDFGCGDGKLVALAGALGIEAYGVDVSASRKAEADASGCTVHPTLDDLCSAVSKPFHMVILNQVLEHVKDPKGLVGALARHMPVGGILFVGVPDCSSIDRPQSFDEFHCVQPIEHINCFTPASLQKLVEATGFVRVRKPSAFVTTRVLSTFKSMIGIALQKRTTDQYFRLMGMKPESGAGAI